jgi:hypothetical protein
MWFPKGNKSHLRKFTKKWFGPYRIQYVLPNNTVILVTIEKFETNPVLVNVNKLKPYKYMEFEIQKYIGNIVQVENFDTEEDDEDCETQKSQMKNAKDEE